MKHFTALIAVLLPSMISAADHPKTTRVFVEGSAIIYRGELNDQANRHAFALLSPNISTLKIESSGGNILDGMAMGDWVREHGLNVEVMGFCFSSCANYIFTAGQRKILARTSMLGWHGGATQKPSVDYVNQLLEFKPEEIALILEDASKQLVRETLFFRDIGVAQISTVYGQREEFEVVGRDCVGWTYSREAMEAFGMQDIEFKDGIWTPPLTYQGKCIYRIDRIQTKMTDPVTG